ncbi:MAG TPA: Pvc16 family protein [Crinalium sp.]|jgi:hypothetical protein
MIPAVAQTLAEILVEGTSLVSTEQIDFGHPSTQQDLRPGLNLYCYDLRECQDRRNLPQRSENRNARWFEVSFLVSARNCTPLGEQRLLSEALMLLSYRRWLPEESLAPTISGYGDLCITVDTVSPTDTVALWSALGAPLRLALYVTVTIPLYLQGASSTAKVLLAQTQSGRGE